MDIQEGLVKHIIKRVLENCTEEFAILERNPEPLQKVVDKPFTRLSYDEAIVKLHELGSDIKHGEDLGNDDEGLLTQDSDVPVFIHKWPKEIKPFYVKRDANNPELALNDDLIGIEGAGEIIGGSQREDNYDFLIERIRHEGLPESAYDWYLDLRKYGAVPHSGFGIGLERMVRWLTQAEHIREAIPFPRTITRIKP
jgi:asparaginyl-tRNA synthetase